MLKYTKSFVGKRVGRDGGEQGWGRGGVGSPPPQAKAWSPELFSWRRRCGKRICGLVIEHRNIKQEQKNMHEIQTKYQY